MWDLVGNPEDRFSHNEAHVSSIIVFFNSNTVVRVTIWLMNINVDTLYVYGIVSLVFEPRSEKTGLRGFRPGPTQTELYSHRI